MNCNTTHYRANSSSVPGDPTGFLLADGPDYLPRHTLSDILVGKQFKDRWTLNLTVLNLMNQRFPFDVNNSFAGSHFNNPREIIGALRYRFHY